MPRPPRIQFEGATYHVFSRGNRRESVFRSAEDYAAFEEIMLEAMRWSGVRLFNWSQLPNHFHFNLETPEGNLSEFMQRVLTRFAKYFNRAHRLVGHVFQGRYGAKLVDQECHFEEIVRYVELNPYRLKKGKLARLGEWAWSSFRYYRLPEDQWPEGCRGAFEQVLERFGQDPESARKNLAAFLAEGLKSGDWEDFYQVKDRRFIGDELFIERAKALNEEPVRSRVRPTLPRMDLGELLVLAQTVSGLSEKDFVCASQARVPSRWRQAVAYIARTFYRVPVTDIGRMLGRDGSTVSHMIQSIQEKQDGSSEIQKLLMSLEERATS